MGKKGQNNGQRQVKLQPSFFQQQAQKYGPDWMSRINTETVRKNALKIFKDLAMGGINVDHEYEFFNNYDFTYALFQASVDNAKYNYYSYYGLSLSPELAVDTEMQKVCSEHYELYTLYNSISIHLNNVLQNLTYYNGAYTRMYLLQLVAEIRWKSKCFNGYFITLPKQDDKSYIKKRREIPDHDKGFSNQGEKGFWGQSH